MTVEARKDALRAQFSAARQLISQQQWAADNAARTRMLLGDLTTATPTTAALYASRAHEPDTRELIDELAARGWRILLPVLTGGVRWAVFGGWTAVQTGWNGIVMPTTVPLPAEALADAELIVVPCLAVGRDGSRLGTGGGWYDRALPHHHAQARIIALARQDEVLDSLPMLAHDIPVHGYVTEQVSVGLRP